MGMYGALVIYNKGDAAAATGPGQGKGGNLYGWTYDKDYVCSSRRSTPASTATKTAYSKATTKAPSTPSTITRSIG